MSLEYSSSQGPTVSQGSMLPQNGLVSYRISTPKLGQPESNDYFQGSSYFASQSGNIGLSSQSRVLSNTKLI